MSQSPIELIRESKLREAQEVLVARIRQRPDSVDDRYNLAGVLTFAGEFDRALGHLEVIAQLHPELVPAVAAYSGMLQAEEERRRCLEQDLVPAVDADDAGARARVALWCACRRGDAAEVGRIRAGLPDGDVLASVGSPTIVRFRDLDDVLGDVLEVYSAGRYLWLPLSSLKRLEFTPPKGLLDLLWAQCVVERTDGRKYTVHVPVLYAGTFRHPDPAVRTGHRTEWVDVCGLVFQGRGQRIFQVGGAELPMLQVRSVEFAGQIGAGHDQR